jgi:hypothetical protein
MSQAARPNMVSSDEAVSLRTTRHCKCGNFNLTHYANMVKIE